MSDVAIRVEGLSKKYQLGGYAQPYNTLRASLVDVAAAPLRAASRLTRRPGTEGEGGRRPEFWALKDVSFDVRQGEVLGIIGRNGAGKSTLLKLLSQITAPTKGCIKMKGRVASLLEVGTGFHPDLTGRENVFLNGAILGMARADITRKFDEIVAFAEVEKFIDTPVKHYSSGMYLRLAFAVAAHLEPEILVVDEVLAVGDAAFQKKCLGTMGSVAHAGRTVLFVSHNMPAIRSLCHRAILLQAGRQAMSGSATSVVASYLAAGAEAPSERVWRDVQAAPGNAKARVHAVRVRDANGDLAMQIAIDSEMTIEVEYWTLVPDTLWLDSGTLIERGTAEQIVSHYLTSSTARTTERVWSAIATAPGNEAVRLQRATIYPQEGSPSEQITIRTPFVIEFDYWHLQADTDLSLSLVLYNEQGTAVFNTFPVNHPEPCASRSSIRLFQSRCHIPGNLLNDGMHRVQLLVVKNSAHVIYTADDVLVFDVFDDSEMRGEWYGDWIGAVRPKITWTTQLIATAQSAQDHRYDTVEAPLKSQGN
jgi:lipopolysaccharide transport system ATP-binding protein